MKTQALLKISALTAMMAVASAISAPSTWAAKPKAASAKAAKVEAATDTLGLVPDALNAKALLEDLLSRRYAQELATVVDRQDFTLGAQLFLVGAPKEEVVPPADPFDNDKGLPSDFMLGTLDTDELVKRYADPDVRARLQEFLSNYRLRSVAISVGLKEGLQPEVKGQVEKWLNDRIKAEFGAAGKGTVSVITEKTGFLEKLSRFQSLAGQLLIALAILLGVLLWSLISGKSSKPANEEKTDDAQQPAATQAAAAVDANKKAEEERKIREEAEALQIAKEVKEYTKRLLELVPKMTRDAETILRSWCQGGDEGKLKLACFSEAAGKEIGKLPIPVDAIQEISDVFAKMPEYPAKDKLDMLKKIYWDLLKAINLGAETLDRPFGYLGNLNIGMVNQALLEQNSKMKALVTLYMPTRLRESYFSTLTAETKRELLNQASEMTEIAMTELKSLDGSFRSKLKTEGENIVPIDSALVKLVSVLSPLEELTILPEMKGAGFDLLKRSTPSLAYLAQWPDEKLSILLGRAMPDEIVGFLRVRPDLKDRFLGLCPPMTAEVTSDELRRPDTLGEADKNRMLAAFSTRLKEMVERQELSLEQIFKDVKSEPSNVTPIGAAVKQDAENEKKAS